jgi:hypothetical protein
MKLELTNLAKEELVRLHKIQDELIESDIDLYFDFSSYDQLLFDLELFVEEAYVENNFDDVNKFATEISDSEGSDVEFVLERLNKAKQLNLITIA